MARRNPFSLLVLLVFGCSGGTIGGSPETDDDPNPPSTGAVAADPDAPDAPASVDSADMSSPVTETPGSASDATTPSPGANPNDPASPNESDPSTAVAPGEPAFLPARLRRLTNAEYEATVRSLLGTSGSIVDAFVPDARQSGFARNAAQIVDPLLARQMQEAADVHAAEFVSTRLPQEAPCATTTADQACARSFYESFLPKAYRRELEDGELEAVMSVFDVGLNGGSFEEAMTLSLAAVLQSAAFVYHTELGTATSPAEATTLAGSEIAAALAYLITGAPPDAELSASEATLAASDVRAEQARRLLRTEAAKDQVSRLIKEWLGIDGVVNVGKDQAKFPQYEQLRPMMLEETDAFIREVAFNEGGSLTTLLSADFTLVGNEMAQFYGVAAPGGGLGRVSLTDTPRRGILNQASFLARYATEVDSAPVRRGVAVGRRVMCVDPGDPTGLAINVVPPQPDPGQTTRERFAQHTVDPECAGCHSGIDGIGFTFEGFDAIGASRSEENGKPVDTATELSATWAGSLDQDAFSDSAELAETLARADSVKRCFTRHLGRYAGAATDRDSENYFVSQWEQMQAENRDSIVEVLVAYVASDLFIQRAPQLTAGAQ